MRAIVITKEKRDYSRRVNEWIQEFERTTGKKLEVLNPDTNTTFCENYDVVEYPTIMILGDDGSVRASWRGAMLPTKDEVLYYLS